MKILIQLLVSAFCGFGLGFILSDVFRIPKYPVSKAIKSLGKRKNKQISSTSNGQVVSTCSLCGYTKTTAQTYTVSYNANGGSNTPASQTKVHGVTLTLSSTIPYRFNYEFLGWSTSSSATTATYTAGASYQTPEPL